MQLTNVMEYLESTVTRLPDKTAFTDGKDSLTFSQLYSQSRAIGSVLASRGIYREPVVVFMEKQPKMISAFFGCVYGGCYYVPIDAEMPKFRIELIFKNLNARAVICDIRCKELLNEYEFSGEVMLYDDICNGAVNETALDGIRLRQLDTDPIYIVFTSGSTGIPKGVIACHRSVIDYIENLSDVLGFNGDTVFGNQSPLYFDACLKELYPTLKFGATTYLIPKQLFMFPIKLVEYLNENKINTICWVVSALTLISAVRTFEKVVPEHLHTVAFGSEVFPIKQFNRWREALPNASFTNLYGPTETTGMCCYFKVDRGFELDEVIPIGRPFRNTEILLIKDDGTEAKKGEVGEICVRGTSLTLGYFNNPEKTSEVFVQNPLNKSYPELIYKTGDLGKLNERGELIFVSRKDYQIKHMGHRIELGEIEVNVNLLGGVNMSGCIYDKEKSKIVLFYTGELSPAELIAILKDKLPRYMIPNKVEQLEAMPFTANGKLDRIALKKIYETKQ